MSSDVRSYRVGSSPCRAAASGKPADAEASDTEETAESVALASEKWEEGVALEGDGASA
jgi:hypothetical protein